MKQETAIRLRATVEGTVQGVGFRPFAFRLAQQLDVAWWITNNSRGALLELEGPTGAVENFLQRLRTETVRIGEVSGRKSSIVVLKTVLGTHRILDLLSGEQIPRIC